MALHGSFHTLPADVLATLACPVATDYARRVLAAGTEENRRLLGVDVGTSQRVELGQEAYVMEMAYLTKRRPDAFFETHERFIDIQVMVTGEECMEVVDPTLLAVSDPYDAGRDLTKYRDTDLASVLRLRAGEAAVFWPADAHMPSLAAGAPALVRKAVIKIPVRRG